MEEEEWFDAEEEEEEEEWFDAEEARSAVTVGTVTGDRSYGQR